MDEIEHRDQGEPSPLSLLDSVTRNPDDAFDDNAFLDGFEEGLRPWPGGLADVRCGGPVNQDLVIFVLGAAQVSLSGLEQIQATDRRRLGFDKGRALRDLAMLPGGT